MIKPIPEEATFIKGFGDALAMAVTGDRRRKHAFRVTEVVKLLALVAKATTMMTRREKSIA